MLERLLDLLDSVLTVTALLILVTHSYNDSVSSRSDQVDNFKLLRQVESTAHHVVTDLSVLARDLLNLRFVQRDFTYACCTIQNRGALA